MGAFVLCFFPMKSLIEKENTFRIENPTCLLGVFGSTTVFYKNDFSYGPLV